VTVRLVRPGRSVLGIDRSAGMAAVAARRLPGRVTLGDITGLPLASGSVDAVMMVWVLHLLHMIDADTAVAEAARVLRPGGLLITTVGKNEAVFRSADDTVAIVGPARARFGHDQTDSLTRVLAVGGQQGLTLTAQTTFVGKGQGLSPRRWRRRLAGHDDTGWIEALDRKQTDALCAELAGLPDQDRARSDPVYQLVALRRPARPASRA
jgi:SAM-dependent methyltransferase